MLRSKIIIKNDYSRVSVRKIVFYNPNRDEKITLKFNQTNTKIDGDNLVVLGKIESNIKTKDSHKVFNLINNSDLESIELSSKNKDLSLEYLGIEVDGKIIDFDDYYLDLVDLDVA